MSKCSFENLVNFLDGELDADKQVKVLEHIGRCSICHEAVYSIIRDRDSGACSQAACSVEKARPGKKSAGQWRPQPIHSSTVESRCGVGDGSRLRKGRLCLGDRTPKTFSA